MKNLCMYKVALTLLIISLTSSVLGSEATVLLESSRQSIVKEFDKSPPVDKIILSPINGTAVAIANNREIAISLDPRKDTGFKELNLMPIGTSYYMMFSGDGSMLVMYSYLEGHRSGTQIVHTKTQQKEFWENRFISAIVPESSWAFTQDSSEQDLVLRDLKSMKELGRLSEHKGLRSLFISADKSSFAAYDEDQIIFYDLKTLKQLSNYSLKDILPSSINLTDSKLMTYARFGDSSDSIYVKGWEHSQGECRIQLPSGSSLHWRQSHGSVVDKYYMYTYPSNSAPEGYNFIVWETSTCSKVREGFIQMPLIYFEFRGFRFEYATESGVWLSLVNPDDLVYWNWKTNKFEFFKVPAGASFIDQRFSKQTKEYIGLSSFTIFGRPAEIVRIPLPY